MSPGVELLTRDVKSCGCIRSSAMDTCPSPFHPRVRTVPVCSVGDTTEVEIKAMAWQHWPHWPQCTPHHFQVIQVTQASHVGERRPSLPRTFRSNSPSLIPKTCLNGLRSFLSFCFSRASNTLMSGPNARSSKSCAKRNSFGGRLRSLSGRAPTGATSVKDGSKCIQSTKRTRVSERRLRSCLLSPNSPQLHASPSSRRNWKSSWGA